MARDGNRKSYSFKSVGDSVQEFRQFNRLEETRVVPIGIKTPIEFGNIAGNAGGLFKMHTTHLSQVRDNFKNLLLTNHGERPCLYDFGANLTELTFELGNETQDSEAVLRISRAVDKYMPFIELTTFEPLIIRDEESQSLAKVGFNITYSIPLLRAGPQGMEVILYTGG